MPIQLPYPIQNISEEKFHNMDYAIMRIAFDIHNHLGRFHDEIVYKNEMMRQCAAAGIQIDKEVPVSLIHKYYSKTLFVDLLINRSTIYELKAAKALAEANRIQTLNYLFATNTQHGKLINFRPSSVEHEFVSTRLNTEKRRNIKILDSKWGSGTAAASLRSLTIGLLTDWGAYLDTDLYMEAIIHLLGRTENIFHPIVIFREGLPLGTKKLPLLSKNEAFCISSVTRNISLYQKHLARLLTHTELGWLHWININRSEISFISLKKKSFCP